MLILLKSERNLARELKEEHLKDNVEYIAEVQKITDVKAIETGESKADKLKDIKLNKEAEIIMNNQVAKVVPIVAKKETIDDTKEIDTAVDCEEQEEVYESALDKFIKSKLNKKLKKEYISE